MVLQKCIYSSISNEPGMHNDPIHTSKADRTTVLITKSMQGNPPPTPPKEEKKENKDITAV